MGSTFNRDRSSFSCILTPFITLIPVIMHQCYVCKPVSWFFIFATNNNNMQLKLLLITNTNFNIQYTFYQKIKAADLPNTDSLIIFWSNQSIFLMSMPEIWIKHFDKTYSGPDILLMKTHTLSENTTPLEHVNFIGHGALVTAHCMAACV